MEQISHFKLNIKLSKTYNNQMDTLEQETTKKIVENFNLIKHFGQSLA